MSNTIIVEVGVQGPLGPKGNDGRGSKTYATTQLMFAATGDPGDIAYCLDQADQWWKWSVSQNTWVPSTL